MNEGVAQRLLFMQIYDVNAPDSDAIMRTCCQLVFAQFKRSSHRGSQSDVTLTVCVCIYYGRPYRQHLVGGVLRLLDLWRLLVITFYALGVTLSITCA